MDSNTVGALAILLPFLFAVFILHNVFKLKREKLQTMALQAKAQSSDLEHRVRVLEKIVTDNNPSLAQEIESLRELPDRSAVKEEIS